MASRYAHDETYTLRVRGLQPPSAHGAGAAPASTKWKALAAVVGAAVSAGALSVAFLSSPGSQATMSLETKRTQLRGSSAQQGTLEVPFDALDRDGDGLVGENELFMAVAPAFMHQEAELRADTSLSGAELDAHVHGIRANYRALTECLRDSLMQMTQGKSAAAMTPGTFEAFRSLVRAKCPDAAAVAFSHGTPAPAPVVENPTVEAERSLPFGDVDMNEDGVVTQGDVMMYMAPHFHALEDEIQGDTTLSDAVKATKIQLVRDSYSQKFECWTRVFHQMLEGQEHKYLVAGDFAAFAQGVALECPDAAFERHDDPLALADAPLPEPETTAQEFEKEVEDASISFVDLDANRDQVLDEHELETFLNKFFDSVVTYIKTDTSLSPEILNVKLQIVQEQYEQQLRCLRHAVAQLAKDGLQITPLTYPILETLMADECSTESEVEELQAAQPETAPSGEQPTAPQLIIGGPGPVILTDAPASEAVVPGQPVEEPQEEHHVESVVAGGEVAPEKESTPEDTASPRQSAELPSLPGRVESDPQPPEPEQAATGNPEGANELKQMLLDEFGLTEPQGGEGETHTTEEPSKEDSDDAKKELKEALLGSLVPSEVGGVEETPSTGAAGLDRVEDKEQQKEAIKEALMDAFLPKDKEKGIDEGTVPVAQERGETEEALKVALLGALAPPDENNPVLIQPVGPLTTIIADGGSWNWLHPSVETYGLVKDHDQETVRVPTVLQHLQQEREARSQPLLAALMKTEADYKHTLECFTKGVKTLSKANMALTREQYAHIVQWMNAKCEAAAEDEEEVQDEEEQGDNNRKFMTKPEFKALISTHFQPLFDDFHLGQLTAEQLAVHAGTVRTKLFDCVERAVENAVDAATGKVHVEALAPALDWVVNVCADMP